MTLSTGKQTKLTDAEFEEMVALKNAINHNPASVHPEKQEEFTAYLVRSLKERGYRKLWIRSRGTKGFSR